MAARITVSTLDVGVTQVRPRVSSVSVVNASVAIAYAIPVTAVDYIELGVSAYLDSSGRFKFVSEIVAVIDSISLFHSKGFADAILLVDDQSKTVSKSLADSISLSETFVKTLIAIRNLADSFSATDSLTKSASKVLSDLFSATDSIRFTGTKALSDGVGLNESFQFSFALVNSVGNVVIVTDDIALVSNYNRSVTDSFGVSDDIAVGLLTNLALSDSFSVTDSATVSLVVGAIVLSDLFAMSDTGGRIIQQNYTEPDYFADDYVGTVTIF